MVVAQPVSKRLHTELKLKDEGHEDQVKYNGHLVSRGLLCMSF